ncbi:hypothetical protein [Candidatus Hepatobacter penaei]|uniref:hypothetical protein n=1 Tax=Candidatus Hepatobacter penaei TaxID=1274402 RepID=UPI0012E082B7|nr:hypothetical protein [Candidatus Hepatobacter penaei]
MMYRDTLGVLCAGLWMAHTALADAGATQDVSHSPSGQTVTPDPHVATGPLPPIPNAHKYQHHVDKASQHAATANQAYGAASQAYAQAKEQHASTEDGGKKKKKLDAKSAAAGGVATAAFIAFLNSQKDATPAEGGDAG